MASELLYTYGALTSLETNGPLISPNTGGVCSILVSPGIHNYYPYFDLYGTVSFVSGPGSNWVAMYGRSMKYDGTNNVNQYNQTLGSFLVYSSTTNYNISAHGGRLLSKYVEVLLFNGAVASISPGWTLSIQPKTVKPQ